MGSELDSTVSEYMLYLKQRCPIVCPSIFPAYNNLNYIEQFFVKPNHKKSLEAWIANNNFDHSNFSFPSVLRFETREIVIKCIKVCVSLQKSLNFKLLKRNSLIRILQISIKLCIQWRN